MTRISIELVPRSYEQLEKECLELRALYPDITMTNIPDLVRMSIRIQVTDYQIGRAHV